MVILVLLVRVVLQGYLYDEEDRRAATSIKIIKV